MVSSVQKGEVDLACSLTVTVQRFEAVDFLLPLGTETNAVFIQTNVREGASWVAFLFPFSLTLWKHLLLVGLCCVLAIKAMEVIFAHLTGKKVGAWKTLEDLIFYYWGYMCTCLGKAFPSVSNGSRTSIRLLVVTIMLAGNITWMTYRASLTSELSNRVKRWPFNTLQGLLASQYQ